MQYIVAYFLVRHRMFEEVILTQDNTFVLACVPAPNTVHLPEAEALSRAIFKPDLPSSLIQNFARGKSSWHGKGTRPDTDFSWVSGSEHE